MMKARAYYEQMAHIAAKPRVELANSIIVLGCAAALALAGQVLPL